MIHPIAEIIKREEEHKRSGKDSKKKKQVINFLI
jgi:hypothetical protein